MSLLALILALLALPVGADEGVTLTVSVRGTATDEGTVMCQVFRGPDGFPTDDPKATAYAAAPIRGGQATCTFYAQAPGHLAIAAYHDENANAKLDTNVFGVPTEGFGFSNDARGGMFGPPAWAEAAIMIGASPMHLTLLVTR